MKRYILIVALIAFISGLIAMTAYTGYYFVYNKFIKTNESMVEVFNDNTLNLVVEDEIVIDYENPRIVDEEILLPIGAIREYIDPHIHWDRNENKVTVTTEDRLIRMQTDSLDAIVNNEPMTLDVPVLEYDGTVFVPVGFLADFYKIDINHIKESGVITIDYRNSIRQIAEPVEEGAVVRTGRSRKNPVIRRLDDINEPDRKKLRVFKEYRDWYKVRTAWGEIGYIEKKYVAVTRVFVVETPAEKEKTPVWSPEKGKISLVWDQVFSSRPNLEDMTVTEGLDVISPTWLHLADSKGKVENYCYEGYVKWAHSKGFKVWALLSNSFDADMTSCFLNSTNARDNLIRQVLAYASLYELDGINIDFENVYLKDRDALTLFVREITPLLKEQGLVVSMDVGVPGGSETYSQCFDLNEIAKTVDYVMLMTYDQHWSTSPVAGSVAQLCWVEKKIKQTLEMVPRDKLLLGLPFYVRVWKEKLEGSSMKLTSAAYSMDYVKKLVEEKEAPVVWDDESGQYYAEFTEDGTRYRIWMEDERSIDLKSALAHKYRLVGTAAWKRGLEKPEIWTVLEKNLKSVNNYFEWKEQYEDNRLAYAD